MEEFIKEHEEEFLDYINFMKEYNAKSEAIKKEITKLKAEFIAQNLNEGPRPYHEEIERRQNRISEIDVEITKIGIGKEVNKLKDEANRNKIINDFNADIKIGELTIEKTQLEDEINEILIACKQNKENEARLKRIEELRTRQKEINISRNEKESLLLGLLNGKIKSIQNILEKIDFNIKSKVNELEKEKEDLQEALNEIIARGDFENEKLNQIKEKTVSRLKIEISDKEKEIQDILDGIDKIKQENIDEIKPLQEIKDNLGNNAIENKICIILGIKKEEEELSDDKEDTIVENIENEETQNNKSEDKKEHYEVEDKEETEEINSIVKKAKSKLKSIIGITKQGLNKYINKYIKKDNRKETINKDKSNEDIEGADKPEIPEEDSKSFIEKINIELDKNSEQREVNVNYSGKTVDEINEIVGSIEDR